MESFEQKQKITAQRLGISPSQMPKSIAIIMDGNGRWAQQKNLPRTKGHQQGGRVVERTALDCVALGIESLVLYSFSIENWKRPKAEIDALMKLYTKYLIGIRPMMMKNHVRLLHMGRRDDLPEKLLNELDKSMEMTADNKGLILGFALNYGGRTEIIDAVRSIAQQYKDEKITIDQIDEKCISQNLYEPLVKDPDLLIRTAGELRVSNFLLWQISYSEFYVTDTLWPDFNIKDLELAITAYAKRVRHFGNIELQK